MGDIMKNKKKLIVCALCAALIGTAVSAEEFNWAECWKNYGGEIEEGDFIVNAGVGLSAWNFNYSSSSWIIPYLEASVEYTKKIWVLPFGFGGYFGFCGQGNSDSDWSYNYINFGGLVNYHIQLPVEKLDVYTGIRMGADIVTHKVAGSSDVGGFFDFNYRLGASYYFTDLIGVNAEIGWPVYLKASVSFKF